MITIVDYGMGNLGAIANMLRRIGADAKISADPADVASAERLILPGVGAFDSGMRQLRERGLEEPLRRRVLEARTPILGICLGMQLFTRYSEEGVLPGLGWIDARTARFDPAKVQERLLVPHMGWNTVSIRTPSELFEPEAGEQRFYFVHSYHVVCERPENVVGVTRYGYDFTSIVAHGNITGVQFHPEKSHRYGLRLLSKFAKVSARA